MPAKTLVPSIGNKMELEEEEWTKLMEKDYHHPFVPYQVQRQFMSTVYKCLEEGKVGVLESPTGTVSRVLPVLLAALCHQLLSAKNGYPRTVSCETRADTTFS